MDKAADPLELRAILDKTPVGTLPLTGYPVLHPDATLKEAAAEMRRCRHGSALVCDGDRLVGIFTERDFLRAITSDAPHKAIRDVMTPDPKFVHTDDSLLKATRLLDEGGYRRLPVLEADGRPAGILDVKGITHFIVEHFPDAIYNQAAHAQLLARHREGA